MEKSAKTILSINQLEIGYKPKGSIFGPFAVDATEGVLIALVGRNGMGKSTLLRTLARLQHPLSGDIKVCGENLNGIADHHRSRLISFVPAEPVHVANLDVRSFVAIARFPYTGWASSLSSTDWVAVDSALQQVGLVGFESKDISQISDGERQRAMIAFALAQDTTIILLDEPTAFLDLPNKFEVVKLLSQLASEKRKTIIYSTHDLQGAITEADSIWMMLPNGLIAGAPEDIALSNGFNDLLVNTNVLFDLQKGTFQSKRVAERDVKVSGQGMQLIWTLKMLQRIGYHESVHKDATLSVECIENNGMFSWRVFRYGELSFSAYSLGDLAKQLKT